jgi:hypothetical protein
VLERLIFESDADCGSDSEKDESDKNLGRVASDVDDEAAAAAFLVIEIVDMVVCARPERVMSTLLSEPNRIEYRLPLVGLYAARGNTSELYWLCSVPPSDTPRGTGKSTVRDGAVNVVTLDEAVKPPDPWEARLALLGSSTSGEGLCGVDMERERTRSVKGAGSVNTRRGTRVASSLSSSSHTALIRRLPTVRLGPVLA